jgi:mRNA interferase ChpB
MGSGTETQGVVLANQARTVDWKARGARHIESAPQTLVDEVLARVIVLLE